MMTNISTIYRYGSIYVRKKIKGYDLSQIDYIFLVFLSQNYCINQDYLCEFLLIEKGTIAKSAAKLEERGYIYREISESDKRKKIIHLSDSGKDLVKEINIAIKEWDNLCLSNFTDDEKNQYKYLNEKLSKNAVEYMKKNRRG